MKKFLYLVATGQSQGIHIKVVKFLLWLLSFVYLALLNLRAFVYKIRIITPIRLPKPVISIGNITTGGVGKTPCVAYVAEKIKKGQHKPAVLMRGYMDEKNALSDEAAWFRQTLRDVPVLVGADRIFEAQKFLKENSCDVFLLDDGFQHIRLCRDLDIVIIDTTDPWGGGHLIPRGFLREPVSRLKRADLFILSRCDEGASNVENIMQKLASVNSDIPIVHAIHRPMDLADMRTQQSVILADLKGKRVVSVCSIGHPHSFKHSIDQSDADLVRSFEFMDHHKYKEGDILKMNAFCQKEDIDIIVTTEKDWPKLDGFLRLFDEQFQLLALRIQFTITKNEEVLLERVHHLL